jgi:hypothetical protein
MQSPKKKATSSEHEGPFPEVRWLGDTKSDPANDVAKERFAEACEFQLKRLDEGAKGKSKPC